MPQLKNPLEVYKLLPQTNCGQCHVPTCLAFSAAVIKGDKKLSDCPYLERGSTKNNDQKVDTRESFDQKREEHLKTLKSKIPSIDFTSSAQRLGANLADEKLVIKCLGKDFLVEQDGTISSICHTHAGLTIPLLSYVIQCKGGDISGQWVHLRELKNGAPMSPLFGQRCEKPLKQLADKHTDLFEDLISMFSGEKSNNDFASDMSVVLYPLPKVPIQICYWKPEDDLDSELNIFFDSTAENHLSIESIYALGAGLVMMFGKIAHKHS